MHRALTLFLFLAVPAAAPAQSGGVVHGTVRSSQGGPIRGAMVGISGSTFYTQTDADGRYRLAPVPPGDVRVRAAAIGYSPQAIVVTVRGADSVTADFALEPSPLELTPLDVVSTKLPRFGDHPVTSVAQVSEQEIDRRAVNTIDEAIDKVPAIQFLNGQINIRGSTGYVQGLNSRVLLLVDGVPMNEGDRGGINWDLVPVDQIERVDILKGAGSSLYGSSALGGVVNLTTRDVPTGVHERVRFTGGVYANPPHPVWEFRDQSGYQGGGDGTWSYGTDEFGASISGGARHSDGYREHDSGNHWQLAGKSRWQPAPKTRVDVSGAWADDKYDAPLSWCTQGQCEDLGQAYQPFKTDTGGRPSWTDSRKGYVAAQARTVVSDRFAWQARGSWYRTDFFDQRRDTSEFGVSNRFGGEIRVEAHPDSSRTVLVGAEGAYSNVTSDIFGDHSQSEFSAYGQSEQALGRARLNAGARIDFLAIDGGSLSAVVSPRLGGSLPLGRNGGALRASVGRGFRAPSLAERFVDLVASEFGLRVVPNPNLRPETAWSFELGGTTAPFLTFMRADAALFWTEARDLIEPTLIVASSGPEIQLQNVAEARIAGLDATLLAAPLSARLKTALSYTYLSTERRAPGSPNGPLAYRPAHQLKLAADYALGPAGVGADFRFASRPESIELEGYVDPRRVPMKVLDFRAQWTHGPFELRLLVANALNYIYNLVPQTLAPVRTTTLTAVWSH
ncbi:MAG TPA: TonB-dependent receptor [Gemmatimonadales bacterium]|nr:TonB-dependent receptor [Gemmatimonadales bacterium]